jgi:hypothetical protein
MSRKAMQMALDMLNEIADHVYFDQKLEGVITALEQALQEEERRTKSYDEWRDREGDRA